MKEIVFGAGKPYHKLVAFCTPEEKELIDQLVDQAVAARTEEIAGLAAKVGAVYDHGPVGHFPGIYRMFADEIRAKFLPAKEADGLSGWSKAQPAESGYYWWRGGAGVIGIVELYAGLRPASWWVKFHGEEKEYPAAECEGEWAGPIYPPREADHAKP